MEIEKTSANPGAVGRFMKNVFGSRTIKAHPEAPEGMRIYVVGDIHGRLDLLNILHEEICQDASQFPNLQIIQIFLGDYVDRGLDSKGVVDWLIKPPPKGWKRICLKGNHEAMVLDFLDNCNLAKQWQRNGGLETLYSYGVDIKSLRGEDDPQALQDDFKKVFPKSHVKFFDGLPLFTEFGDYFFAHAGVRPGILLHKQKKQDLLWIRDDFLSSQMDFGKVVVHGHTPTEKPQILPNRINIDTGAYITGDLTCLVLESKWQRFL